MADESVSSPPAQFFQLLSSGIQSLQPLAEREPHLLRTIARILIKTRSGHSGYADLFHEMAHELNIIGNPKVEMSVIT